jgi:predicted ATPase/DNA-binding SARP family transcriptional activator
MSHSLKLFLFGSPQIEEDGQFVTTDTRKAVALLAYLTVSQQNLARSTLATLLWPDSDERHAHKALSRTLSALNSALKGKWIEADHSSLSLMRRDGFWADIEAFRELTAKPNSTSQQELAALQTAVQLYRGDFMAGFSLRGCAAFDDWQSWQSERFRREVLDALEKLVAGYSSQGRFNLATDYAEQWINLDPLHEPAHRQLMLLYAWAGRRADALRQYEKCAQLLEVELGIAPQPETSELYNRLRNDERLPAPARASVVLGNGIGHLGNDPHPLPPQSTSFVGRESEVADIVQTLNQPDCRLLTILGLGGVGKTRLAIQAASQLQASSQAVCYVPLAAVPAPQLLPAKLADSLQFTFYGQQAPKEQILNYLRSKAMLLVLDNFEHLLEGADLVADILQVAPGIKILATSRERLLLEEEQVFPLEGLDFPEGETAADASDYAALRLFVQSARRVRPDFELKPANLAPLAHICRRVEGMPLAIILAAAGMEMLTPAEIAAEVDRDLDFLETELGDVPERQRSLRAVFDYSWNLLTEREQRIFEQLSVFRGGFSRAAGQAVSGASLPELFSLVKKSLLSRSPSGRFDMHELLRQYAAEKLAQSPRGADPIRDHACAYYAATLEEKASNLRGARESEALAEIEVDIENIHAAWYWAVERGQVARLAQLLEGLSTFYQVRGRYQEGVQACLSAVARLEQAQSLETSHLMVRLLAWQTVFLRILGRASQAEALLNQATTLLDQLNWGQIDTRPERAFLLQQKAWLTADAGRREEARWLLEEQLTLRRAMHDEWGTATALWFLSWIEWLLGDFEKARSLSEESLAIRQKLGNRREIADSLNVLAGALISQGEVETSEKYFREVIAIRRHTEDQPGVALALANGSLPLLLMGRFEEAGIMREESLRIFTNLGDRFSMAHSHLQIGTAALLAGSYDLSERFSEAGLTMVREIGYQRGIGLGLWLQSALALVRGRYSQGEQSALESVAIYRSIGQREELALAQAILGGLARGLGKQAEARREVAESLRMAGNIRAVIPLWAALAIASLLLADTGEKEGAVELYTLASRYPFIARSPFFEAIAGRYIQSLILTLSPASSTAAQERGRNRDMWEAAEAVVIHLKQER